MGATFTTPGTAASVSAISRPTRIASLIGVRRSLPGSPSRSSDLAKFSSVLAPMPGSSRSSWRAMALRSASTEATPSSSRSKTAVLGPTPCTLVNSTNSGGNWARSSSRRSIRPSSTNLRILSAVLLPTPRKTVSSVADISPTGSGCPSTERAAVSYARTRKALLLPSARVVSRASSYRCDATSLLETTPAGYEDEDHRVKRVLIVIAVAATLVVLQVTRPDIPAPGSDCEPVAAGILRQPGNASTSVVLLLAGVILAHSLHRARRMIGFGLLIAGTAAALAHTTLHPWAFAADGVAAVIAVGLGVLALPGAIIRPRLMVAAVVLGAAAITLWALSRSGGPLCDPDAILTGHAGWHLLVTLAAIVAAASLTDSGVPAEAPTRPTLDAGHGPS